MNCKMIKWIAIISVMHFCSKSSDVIITVSWQISPYIYSCFECPGTQRKLFRVFEWFGITRTWLTVSGGSLVVDVDVFAELVPHLPAGSVPPLLPDVLQLFPGVLVRLREDVLERRLQGQTLGFKIAVLMQEW